MSLCSDDLFLLLEKNYIGQNSFLFLSGVTNFPPVKCICSSSFKGRIYSMMVFLTPLVSFTKCFKLKRGSGCPVIWLLYLFSTSLAYLSVSVLQA